MRLAIFTLEDRHKTAIPPTKVRVFEVGVVGADDMRVKVHVDGDKTLRSIQGTFEEVVDEVNKALSDTVPPSQRRIEMSLLREVDSLKAENAALVEVVEGLKGAITAEEISHGQTIDERDMREEQVTKIARALGVTSEWSNLHDLGAEALEAALAILNGKAGE